MKPGLELLGRFLNSLADISVEQLRAVEPLISTCSLAKGEVFLRIGEVSREFGFVTSGLLRRCFTDAHGNEYNNYFATTGQLIGSYESLRSGRPSQVRVEALEDSTLLVMKFADHLAFSRENPTWREASLKVAEWIGDYREKRETQLLALSTSERYAEFVSQYPDLAKRIPQYHIASYIGVTPEGLSRLLKKQKQEIETAP